VACAFVATFAFLWGVTGVAILAFHKLSGWLLRTYFVASGTESSQTAPMSADSDGHARKPRDVQAAVRCCVQPLEERLSELGVRKGSKLKVVLPKLPRKASTLHASDKARLPTPPSSQYQFPEEGPYLDPGQRPGTYEPPPPYRCTASSKPRRRRTPSGQ